MFGRVAGETITCTLAVVCEKSSGVCTCGGERCIRLGLLCATDLSTAVFQTYIESRYHNCKLIVERILVMSKQTVLLGLLIVPIFTNRLIVMLCY